MARRHPRPYEVRRRRWQHAGVAGLWQTWKSPLGEWVSTFTMLTLSADDHDLMKYMRRPDPTSDSFMTDANQTL
ncbi:SOS response-associated peptidase family protein [Variovorax sp. LT1P1]|uniref:SOS response-associated peptidase family protein n=1 Tax=Variovorax sp. LT1P1 TaxID=3443730 RepID=UPI003F48EBDD